MIKIKKSLRLWVLTNIIIVLCAFTINIEGNNLK